MGASGSNIFFPPHLLEVLAVPHVRIRGGDSSSSRRDEGKERSVTKCRRLIPGLGRRAVKTATMKTDQEKTERNITKKWRITNVRTRADKETFSITKKKS